MPKFFYQYDTSDPLSLAHLSVVRCLDALGRVSDLTENDLPSADPGEVKEAFLELQEAFSEAEQMFAPLAQAFASVAGQPVRIGPSANYGASAHEVAFVLAQWAVWFWKRDDLVALSKRCDSDLPDLFRLSAMCDQEFARASQLATEKIPNRQTQVAENGRQDKIAAAIGILMAHPDWTNQQIANEIGCHVKYLSKNQMFRVSRQTIKQHGQSLRIRSKENRGSNMDEYGENEKKAY